MEKQTPNSFLAEKEAQEAFFRADTDGGGHIDIHELSTLLHGLLSDQIEAKAVSAGSPALRGLHICNGGDSGGMVEQCVLEALSMITPPCTCACCRAIARRPTSAGSCGTNFVTHFQTNRLLRIGLNIPEWRKRIASLPETFAGTLPGLVFYNQGCSFHEQHIFI